MDAPRQDAWKKEEDVLLAKTVISYIKEGKTQLEAFQKVAGHVKRTPAACGFRWNATVRKDYQDEIKAAKQNRKQNRQIYSEPITSEDSPMSLDAAISLLKEMKIKQSLSQGQENLEQQLRKLNEDNTALKNQLKEWEAAWNEMDRLVHWVKARKKTPTP